MTTHPWPNRGPEFACLPPILSMGERDILARGHEIAHHGYEHEHVWKLDPEGERQTFVRGLEALRDVTGQSPRGWRAPGGEMSPRSIDLLAEHVAKDRAGGPR